MWKIINPYKMARAVRDHKVFYEEYIAYIFIFFVLIGIFIPPRHLTPSENASINYAIRTLTILGIFLPFIVAYIANKEKNGSHFWYRFISVLAPIRIIMLFFLAVSSFVVNPFLFYFNRYSSSLIDHPLASWSHVIFYALYHIIFNIVVYKSMRIASSGQENILPNNQSFCLAGKNRISRIINPYKMIPALQENRISKKEYTMYAILFAIWLLGNLLIIFIIHSESLSPPYISLILSLIGLFAPPAIAYIANKKGDNAHFWYRMVSMNIPIVITVTIVTLIMAIMSLATMMFINILWQSAIKSFSNAWDVAPLVTAFFIIQSIMTSHYMRMVSSTNERVQR